MKTDAFEKSFNNYWIESMKISALRTIFTILNSLCSTQVICIRPLACYSMKPVVTFDSHPAA
jgi:hypothetical protein